MTSYVFGQRLFNLSSLNNVFVAVFVVCLSKRSERFRFSFSSWYFRIYSLWTRRSRGIPHFRFVLGRWPRKNHSFTLRCFAWSCWSQQVSTTTIVVHIDEHLVLSFFYVQYLNLKSRENAGSQKTGKSAANRVYNRYRDVVPCTYKEFMFRQTTRRLISFVVYTIIQIFRSWNRCPGL